MSFLLLLPPILSLLLLAAHCLRLAIPLLMAFPLATVVLLALPRRWVAYWTRLVLILGTCEWIRITAVYVAARRELGMPWGRLTLILGAVSAWTLLSSFVFQSRALRRRYELD